MDPERDTETPTETPLSAPLELSAATPEPAPELAIERVSLAARPADEAAPAEPAEPAETEPAAVFEPVGGESAEIADAFEPAEPSRAGEPADRSRAGEPADAIEEAEPDTALSPAVRRLVRQYDLDITGIHGTGPAGRIRVGDVIALIGARGDGASRDAARNGTASDSADERASTTTPYRGPAPAPVRSQGMAPTTTVFECDVSRALGHRKRLRRDNVDVLLTSYFVVACAEALKAVPEIVAHDAERPPRLGVHLCAADGEERAALLDTGDDSPLGSIADRLRSVDGELRANGDDDGTADLLIHHYGASGSVLATPTPLGAEHVASVGIGRVRREIVVKEGEESPRVAAVCYVSLTFLPNRLALRRANRFLAQLVRVLEQWPD